MVLITNANNVDSFGNQVVGIAPSEGSIATFVSPDYTKKYTWWYSATDVTGETLSLSSGTTYSFANQHVICKSMITDGNTIAVGAINRDLKIYDNGVEINYGSITSKDFITGIIGYSGGDITQIDYTSGTVTFVSAPTGPITADYSYSAALGGSSIWEVVPKTGKILRINVVELQITGDVTFPPDMIAYFDVMVNTVSYGWVPYASNQYKSYRDLVARSNRGYRVPVTSEMNASEIIVLPWDYPATIDLKYDLGTGYNTPSMKLQFRTKNDTPFNGEWGLFALYCISADQSV